MGWLYILIRTFPFWAIPVAITLLTLLFSKASRKLSSKAKLIYVVVACALLGISAAFFLFQGPLRAVPFVHQMIYGASRLVTE